MSRPLIRIGQVWRLDGQRYRCIAVDDSGAKLAGIDAPGEVWSSLDDGVPWDARWVFETPAEC
jgi:hypothetical protein